MSRVITFGEIMGRMTPGGVLRFRQSLPGKLDCTFAGAEATVAASIAYLGGEAAFVSALPHLNGLDILPYHNIAMDKYLNLGKPYRLFETRRPSEERLAEIAQRLNQFGLGVTIGG